MKLIFFIIVFLIVYGSLFPFDIIDGEVSENSLETLFDFNIEKTVFSDLVANIILFIPFGLFIKAAFPSRFLSISFAYFMLIGFAFAFLIQAMQLWTVNRLPWGGDAIWNSVGCAIGLIIHSTIKLKTFKHVHEMADYQQISLALASALIVIKLAPFAPSMDVGILKDNLKSLLQNPSINPYSFFEYSIVWLVAFYLLEIANPKWAKFKTVAAIVCGVLSLKFFIVSNQISLSQLIAGGFALLMWRFLPIKNTRLLAMLMLLAIIGYGLRPFEFSETIGTFNWLPFTGAIRGNLLGNIMATVDKLVLYGSFIWLVYLAQKRLLAGTLICAMVLFGSEYLQIFFTDSVSEITDPILAIIMAFVFSQKLKLSNAEKSLLDKNEALIEKRLE